MKKLISLVAVAALLFTLAPADAAPWTPAEIATTLWLDGDDASTITDSSGFVSQWNDKSGNNNHATQGAGSQQPQTGLSTIGGLNVIAFDGTNDYLTVQPFSSPQPHTVFFVAKTTGGPGRDYVFDGANANGDRNLVALDRSGTVQFWAGSWVDSGVGTPTDPLIVAAAFNTSSSEFAIDGTNATGLNPGSFTMTDGMNLGTNYTESVDWLEGDIAEFIIVSGAPDTDTRQTVEGYLAWKWGLQGNLPGGHPYEFAAPQIADAVPEPSSLSLLVVSLVGLSLGRRRRNHCHRIALTALACIATITMATTSQAGTVAYRNTVLADNPIVYYEFDETSGTTADNIGSGGATNDGTIVSTVTLNQASFLNGGTAYDFGGGRVTSAAFPTLTEWTVEAWINWDSAKTSASNFFGNDQGGWNDDVIFGIGAEAGGQGVPSSNVGLIQQGSPGSTRDFVTDPLTHSVWHHVVATGSTTDGELKLYVDGAPLPVDTDSSLFNGITMNGHQFAVGAARFVNDAGTRPFDGLIDEFALYGTVLDASTITAHYNAGISTAPEASLTPEPSSLSLLVVSLVGLSMGRRRRNR